MSHGTTSVAPLAMETSEHGDYAVIRVQGEVDVYTASTLRKRLADLHDRGCRSLIVDACGIEFIDSSGLGVLVGAYKRSMRGSGHGLFVVAPSHRVTASLKITGLDQVFHVSRTVEDAVAELQRRREAR